MVGPLTLTLEARRDRVVTQHFLAKLLRQVGIALNQILDDAVHLDGKRPLLILLLAGKAYEVGVVVAAFLAMLASPRQRLLVLFLVVDALLHAAQYLYLVHGLDAQAQIVLHERLVHDGAADAHADRANLQIALAAHGSNRDSRTAKAKQLLLNILGDVSHLIAILHFVAIDAERRQTLLRMGGQNACQIYRAGTLGAVEAPYALDGVALHVHRFGAIAPARGYGQRHGHVLTTELGGAGRRLGHAADGGIGDNNLDRLAVGIAQILSRTAWRLP